MAGLVPAIATIVILFLFPDSYGYFQNTGNLLLKAFTSHLSTSFVATPRSATPLVISAVTHWSHFEKIAKVAVVLANLGYPITLVTGSVFEKEAWSLHPNITFYPLLGEPDKLTPEQYATYASFPPGSEESELYIQKVVLVDGMQAAHETLQHVFQDFKDKHGDTKPLLSLYDLPFVGHLPILLGAPGIKPDVSFAISNHPITLDSNDTYPPHIDKIPEVSPNAKAIHFKAHQDRHEHYRTRELDIAWWSKLRELGALRDEFPSILHAMAASPDHLMTMGIPEFEWPRSDLRKNIHYFGALRTSKADASKHTDSPRLVG